MTEASEIHSIEGVKYRVWRARICDEMVFEKKSKAWFAERLDEPKDIVVVGVPTKKECVRLLYAQVGSRYNKNQIAQVF